MPSWASCAGYAGCTGCEVSGVGGRGVGERRVPFVGEKAQDAIYYEDFEHGPGPRQELEPLR